MKNFTLFISLLLSILYCSCSKTDDPIEKIDAEITTKNAQIVVQENNTFAFNIFKEVAANETEENFMISPVSLSLALGMAYNGADGNTKIAFDDVLNYNMPLQEVNEFNKNLISKLSSNADGSIMEIANSIWIHENFPVKNEFISLNQNYYDAEVQNLDFLNPSSVNTINDWVSNKTHAKIPEIIKTLSPEDKLILINALYFNANWKYDFDPEYTTTASFYKASESIAVEMMTHTTTLAFTQNDIFSSVVLPYEKEKFSMLILLPNEQKTTEDVISEININNWNSWLSSYDSTNIALFLPKFKLDYENKLNNELTNLGLGVAFTDQANFNKISDIDLLIDYVIQKTFIDVNEEGTEAAAVTAIGFINTSVGGGSNARIFNVNKPFVYIIKENVTGSICFIGKVGSPEYHE